MVDHRVDRVVGSLSREEQRYRRSAPSVGGAVRRPEHCRGDTLPRGRELGCGRRPEPQRHKARSSLPQSILLDIRDAGRESRSRHRICDTALVDRSWFVLASECGVSAAAEIPAVAGPRHRFDQTIVCLVTDFQRLELLQFGLRLFLRRFGVLDLAGSSAIELFRLSRRAVAARA